MEGILVEVIGSVLGMIVSVGIFIYAIFYGLIKWKEIAFMILAIIIMYIGGSLVTKIGDINEKLGVEFKVPTELVSDNVYINDSTIDDSILYDHLLSMRAKHPKVILIQAKIESGNYSSKLFQRNNNMFGMKISRRRVTTSSNGKAGYKDYANWQESVTDYILWQFSNNGDKLSTDDYIKYLGKIYAEDPNYTKKIRKMLKEIDFDKLEM